MQAVQSQSHGSSISTSLPSSSTPPLTIPRPQEDELTNGNSYPDVKALVTSLLRNYQLKSSLDSALALLPSSISPKTKEDAKLHAKTAYENLILILEYFPEDQSGPLANKTLKPEQVTFTIKALQATRKELRDYMGFFDEGLREKLAEGVAST